MVTIEDKKILLDVLVGKFKEGINKINVEGVNVLSDNYSTAIVNLLNTKVEIHNLSQEIDYDEAKEKESTKKEAEQEAIEEITSKQEDVTLGGE